MIAFVLSLIPFVFALFALSGFNLWLTGWCVEFRSEMPSLLVALFPHALDRDASSVSKGADLSSVLLRDFALVALFGLQHSIMARPAFKRAIVRWGFPVHLERSLFVLASCIVIHLIPMHMQSFGPELYSTSGAVRTLIQSVRLFGVVFLHVALLSFDMFDLLGVKQAYHPEAYVKTLNKKPTLTTNGLWGYIRHPIMTGFLLILWSAPDMTLGRLYISALFTAYIVLAVFAFEEPDLRCAFAKYDAYSRVVPPFFPHSFHRATVEQIDAAAAAKTN